MIERHTPLPERNLQLPQGISYLSAEQSRRVTELRAKLEKLRSELKKTLGIPVEPGRK